MGNVEYFTHLLSSGCVIDMGENYVKQSYRNRCEIMSAGGVDVLTVNVVNGGSRTKRPVRDMRIDYSKRWQHRHRMALISAYKNSPYFDHYWERFAPFYEKRYEFLADLNMGLLSVMAGIIAPNAKIDFSEIYIEPSDGCIDLRGSFEPVKRDAAGGIIIDGITSGKSDGSTTDSASGAMALPFFEPYIQVFSEKHPFAPNLSAIDLIFCEGPNAKQIMENCN